MGALDPADAHMVMASEAQGSLCAIMIRFFAFVVLKMWLATCRNHRVVACAVIVSTCLATVLLITVAALTFFVVHGSNASHPTSLSAQSSMWDAV